MTSQVSPTHELAALCSPAQSHTAGGHQNAEQGSHLEGRTSPLEEGHTPADIKDTLGSRDPHCWGRKAG